MECLGQGEEPAWTLEQVTVRRQQFIPARLALQLNSGEAELRNRYVGEGTSRTLITPAMKRH